MNMLMNMALNMLSNNPQVANNPRNKAMIEVIQNGDSKKGEEIATNLCQTYNTSKEDAYNQALQFFGLGGK